MIDLNSASCFSDRVNWFVDSAFTRWEEKKRDYLGVSAIGGKCDRAVQFTALAVQGLIESKTFEPRVRRIFHRGHQAEDWCVEWLRRAGFLLINQDFNGNQFEVRFLDGYLRGHCDGILTHFMGQEDSPVELPALWECKCLGSKGWNSLRRDGVRKAYPGYYSQVQLYMHGLKLERCVFTALNADSMELHHEQVLADRTEAQRMIDRAARVKAAIEHCEWLPRGGMSETDFTCKFCDYKAQCWN